MDVRCIEIDKIQQCVTVEAFCLATREISIMGRVNFQAYRIKV